jgi:hypothetical protein
MLPSARFALSLNPNVAYRALNFGDSSSFGGDFEGSGTVGSLIYGAGLCPAMIAI